MEPQMQADERRRFRNSNKTGPVHNLVWKKNANRTAYSPHPNPLPRGEGTALLEFLNLSVFICVNPRFLRQNLGPLVFWVVLAVMGLVGASHARAMDRKRPSSSAGNIWQARAAPNAGVSWRNWPVMNSRSIR